MATSAQQMTNIQPSSKLSGSNTLLLGPAGSGKTTAIGTLADAAPELDIFFVPLESGLQSLFRYFHDRQKPIPPNLHWVPPISIGRTFKDLATVAHDIGVLPEDSLFKMQDNSRSKGNQFERILRLMCDFTDHTGRQWGPVDGWGPDRAIVFDGLSGLSTFARHMVVGVRPAMSPTNWNVAQIQIENFIRLLSDGCRCHFILIAHIEREMDQVTGGIKLMPKTLGKALPPIIPSMFNDVVLAVKQGDKFSWDTANIQVDLKTSLLPIAAGQPPDFSAIIQRWKSLGGRFTSTVATSTEQ